MIKTVSQILQNQELTDALALINKSKKITFLTHVRPDADGISACAALSSWCHSHGKSVETIYPSKPEGTLYAEPENVYINSHHQIPDLLIVCDTANHERLYFPDFFKTIPLITIDHHISCSIEGTFTFIATEVSSTCELLYFLLNAWDATAITQPIASLLLFGILYDSQSFQTTNTRTETLEVAATLMKKGANLQLLNRKLLATKSIQTMRAWGHLLQNMESSPSGSSVLIILTEALCRHYNTSMDAIQDIHSFVIFNMPVDVVVLFKELSPHETKLSLRSSKTDVNALAQKFGGGGHIHAAGLLLKMPLSDAVALIRKELP